MARIGNVWISAGELLIDEYRARRQAEAAGDPYTGPMDDESYRIITEAQNDQDVVGGIFKTAVNNDYTYKLFNYTKKGSASVKEDIDYLYETWGNDARPIGSWWFDTGIQGGMQPGANPEDPPTGYPFYPIPNNAFLFMPDIVEYDEEGNEISRTPATSNDDLRDVLLMLGQHPRDLVQYAGEPAIVTSGARFTLTAEKITVNRAGYDRDSGFGAISAEPGNLKSITTRTSNLTLSVRVDDGVQDDFTSIIINDRQYFTADAEWSATLNRWRWPLQGGPLLDAEDYLVILT